MSESPRRALGSACEAWLVGALAASAVAALLFHHAAGLVTLPRGGAVGRFWWGAFALCYLGVALVALLVSELAVRASRRPWLGPALQILVTASFLGGALWLERAVVGSLFAADASRLGAAALLLALSTAAFAVDRSVPRRWSRRALAATALGVTWLALDGRPVPAPVPPPTVTLARPTGQRLLLVGVDGADPRFLDALIAAGELPHFAALRAAGVSGNLATLRPTSSPAIWTTMITGRMPREHGVQSHVFERPRWILERVPDQGGQLRAFGADPIRRGLRAAGLLVLSPATSRERRVPAFWNVTTHFRQPLSVVGWWATWPAESILGRISSDRINYFRWEARGATDRDRHRITFPETLYPKLQRLILPPSEISYEQARRFVDVDREQFERDRHRAYSHHDVRSEFTLYYSQFETDRAVADFFLRSDQAARQMPMDLLVLFRLVDQTSHCCLKYSDLVEDHLDSRPDEIQMYGRVVREAYRTVDEALGKLMELFGTGNVVVVSDHGFERSRGKGAREYAHPHAPPGVFIASGPAFRRGRVEGLAVADLMSILLYLKGLPISDEIRAPLRQDLFDDAFRATTPVLRVPTFGGLIASETMAAESSGDERLLEELKALGYIQ